MMQIARRGLMQRLVDMMTKDSAIAPSAEVKIELRNTGGIGTVPDLAMELAGKGHLTRGPYETMSAFMERMRLVKFGRKPRKAPQDYSTRSLAQLGATPEPSFENREYKMFQSPGRIVEGFPRPTAPRNGAPLNQVEFTGEKALLFSDGSFRVPGRRRLKAVTATGQVVTLSGRQLRKLRKRTRRTLKLQQQEVVATV